MKDLRITETKAYDLLVPLFIANRLEFSEDEPVPTDIVKCWQLTGEDGSLQGGAVLALREGQFIVDGIAVNEPYRKTGAGRRLLDCIIDETASRGGSSIFLVARAPGFFRKSGFVTIGRDEAPQFFECFTCPQYGTECRPEVMRLQLK